jgi:hypothetical protein
LEFGVLDRIAAARLAEYNDAQDAQPTPTCLPTGEREWDPDTAGGELFACNPGPTCGRAAGRPCVRVQDGEE